MTDDITNDLALLDDWLAGKGYGEEAGLAMRAMDLIRKQAVEIEKLRAALKPFADELRSVCLVAFDTNAPDDYTVKQSIPCGIVRAAKAALEGE